MEKKSIKKSLALGLLSLVAMYTLSAALLTPAVTALSSDIMTKSAVYTVFLYYLNYFVLVAAQFFAYGTIAYLASRSRNASLLAAVVAFAAYLFYSFASLAVDYAAYDGGMPAVKLTAGLYSVFVALAFELLRIAFAYTIPALMQKPSENNLNCGSLYIPKNGFYKSLLWISVAVFVINVGVDLFEFSLTSPLSSITPDMLPTMLAAYFIIAICSLIGYLVMLLTARLFSGLRN